MFSRPYESANAEPKMSMQIIEIHTGERQHNFLVVGEDVCKTVGELKQFCYCRFPHLENEKDLRIYWNDQEGDEFSIITDGDYRSFMLATDGRRRLHVEGSEPARVSDDASIGTRPVHSVICDVCDQVIEGHRYRCLTCHDYDLCMTCEGKYRHKEHIMLRIPRPTAGPRMLTFKVLENIEREARNLNLSTDVLPQQAKKGDVGGRPPSQSCSRQTTSLFKRRTRVPYVSAIHEADAAADAMVHERAQARLREVFSRYVDPANIKANVEPASSSSTPAAPTKDKVNVGAPPQSTGQEEVLTETQRSVKVASEAAKVAAAAAMASWNTFKGCAGLFVPVTNSSSSSSTATETSQNQNATPIETKSELNDGSGMASNASVVSGLVGEVLKHTPPELKEFLPKEDEMTRFGENLSTLLSQLGIELPKLATEAGEATSSSVAPNNDTQAKTSDKQQAGVEGEKEKQDKAASQSSSKFHSKPLFETDSVAVGNHSAAGIKLAEEPKELAVDQDQCSADTYSALLLTDDDDAVVEMSQISEEVNLPEIPVASSSRPEHPWVLIDLPKDGEEAVKPTVTKPSTAPSTSHPLGPSTPSTSSEHAGDEIAFREPRKVPSSPSPVPSTSAPRATNEATMVGPSTVPAAAPLRTNSSRPHVNHAMHTMMGFSNNEGHLTQLLEALDGDIPWAIDLLMQKLP